MAPRAIPLVRITSARRKELQRAYEGVLRLSQAGRAAEAFPLAAQCVVADPDGDLYVHAFAQTLEQSMPTQFARGSWPERLQAKPGQRHMEGLAANEDWQGVLQHGLSVLGEKPFSLLLPRLQILLLIADACRQSQCFDSELAWLQVAYDLASQSLQTPTAAKIARKNVQLREALTDRLADAHLRRGNVAIADALRNESPTTQQAMTSDEQESHSQQFIKKLEAAIADNPSEVDNYLTLADHFQSQQDWESAERVLSQACFVEPSSTLRTQLEDAQMAKARHKLSNASARLELASPESQPALQAAVENLENECLRIECEIFRTRSERDRGDAESRFRLAECLARLGNRTEAIRELKSFNWPSHLKAQVAELLETC